MRTWDIAVLGGGSSGMAAAAVAAREGASVVLLEKLALGGQALRLDHLDEVPGLDPSVSGFDFAAKLEEELYLAGVEVLPEEATGIEPGDHAFAVRTDRGEVTARALILALGLEPRVPDLPGIGELLDRGVSFCAPCDGPLFKNKTVAVYGGGDSAADEAAFLAGLCSEVLLVFRGGTLGARPFLQRRLAAFKNIRLFPSTALVGLETSRDSGAPLLRSATIETRDAENGETRTKKVEIDGLFLALGGEARSRLFRDAFERAREKGLVGRGSKEEDALDSEACVKTGPTRESLVPGIFAVGSLRAAPPGPKQIVNGFADALAAGRAAAARVLAAKNPLPAESLSKGKT